jgi:hypothetical protein
VAAFTDEVCKYPTLFPQLEVLNLDGLEFRSA